jgi:tetratricopeptide (TPR) repeat protein
MSNDPGAKGYLLEGVSLLKQALRRDPDFLLAQCLLSEIQSDLYWFGFDHTPERLDASHKALQQAERIQPDAGEVHLQKGIYAYHGFRDYDQALAEFELARKSLPNSSKLYLYLGVIDRRQSRWDDAIKNMNRAVELDPRNFLTVEEAAFTAGGLGHSAKATRLLQRAIELSPKDYFARMQLAMIPYFDRGDLEPLRVQLAAFEKEGAEATANAAQTFLTYALAKRDPAAAAQALTFIPAEGSIYETTNFLMPRDWFVGLVARTFGDTKEAERAFTAARAIEAKIVQAQPDYAPAWSLLGMIDAGLGDKADAITEGKRACELLPVSKDSWEGPIYVTNLALIYAWVGEKDLAFEQLGSSVKTPGGITYGELKMDPQWESLRQDPRFRELLKSAAASQKSAAL